MTRRRRSGTRRRGPARSSSNIREPGGDRVRRAQAGDLNIGVGGVSWRQADRPARMPMPGLGALNLLRRPGTVTFSPAAESLVAGQSRVTVRDVEAVPGSSASWSVGLGFVPNLNARARIERYGRF
jgi:hypothetical protein